MQEKMSKTFSLSVLSLCLILHLFPSKCSSSLAPALYIFGDSLLDSGNNNFLQTLAKVDYGPYGIDFPAGPTGRFTNGKTFGDFIAQFLGLPFAPPYLGLPEAQRSKIITGINYASGSAGILQETGSAIGVNLALQTQIGLFGETVHKYLPSNFKTNDELLNYLSKSIFIVDIGSNDYLNNYLLPAQYNTSHLHDPVQFASFLLDELKQHLLDLYKLGARKFLVFNLGPVGCTPGLVKREKIKSGCANDINQMVSLYNKGFPSMLQQLRTSLMGSTFVQGDIFTSRVSLSQNPSKYGFNTITPCCVTSDENFLCRKDVAPCLDRASHAYWDEVHPTHQANLLLANGCFNGTTPCTPINVLQLAIK